MALRSAAKTPLSPREIKTRFIPALQKACGQLQRAFIGDMDAGQKLGLQPVGLEGMDSAEDILQLVHFGGGYRVHKQGDRRPLSQEFDGFLGDVGVHYAQAGPVNDIQLAG